MIQLDKSQIEMLKYTAVGAAAIAIFLVMAYISPWFVFGLLGLFIFLVLSMMLGYTIVDAIENRIINNEKNKSGKTPSSSTNDR